VRADVERSVAQEVGNESVLAWWRVPRALLRHDGLSYAVYSFEPGAMRPAAELTRRDVKAIAAFTADLVRFGPRDLAGEFAASRRRVLPADRAPARHTRPPGEHRDQR
jgi:hypothetical protein